MKRLKPNIVIKGKQISIFPDEANKLPDAY